MWWKLSGLVVLTVAMCLAVIPIRTHAVIFDPSNPPAPWTFRAMLGKMYLTPTAGLLVAAIVAVSAFVAFKLVRGQW